MCKSLSIFCPSIDNDISICNIRCTCNIGYSQLRAVVLIGSHILSRLQFNNIWKSYPLPALRDVKRHFICNADRLIFADLLIRQIIGKTQDSNLCVSRYRHKTVKWILSALPFSFCSKFVKFPKLYSKTALRIPISVGAFKIFCKTAFL